jgi:PAS domain S-box-containing protein
VLWTSRNITDVLGYTAEDVVALGEALFDTLVHPEDAPRLREANDSIRDLGDGAVLTQQYRVRRADGEYRWFARRITPFARDEISGLTQVLGVARDVSEVVAIEERLREAALHDALTGLPNRTLLNDRLASALARAHRSGGEVAVLFCDLDGFKAVNDSGARIGGDEFVIILEPSPSRDAAGGRDPDGFDARSVADAVAERVRRAVASPVVVGSRTHRVTVSIGITFAGAQCSAGAVLRSADTAMYRAKSRGKNCYELSEAAKG